MDIRHIKITSSEGLYRINDKKAFKGLIVSLNTVIQPKTYDTEKRKHSQTLSYTGWCEINHSNMSHFFLILSFSLQEMIQFYQQNSLKEYFKDVDTTLRTPFKQPEQSNSSNNTMNATPGTVQYLLLNMTLLKEQLMGVLAFFQQRTNPT